tara:strand:- start:3805 stop:3987 length:183 start_codon:yes stop_codon:yes gene_type:complete
MLTKSRVKKTLDQLPEEFSLDDLMDRMILIDKIEKGNVQSVNNEVISENELDKKIKEWFK